MRLHKYQAIPYPLPPSAAARLSALGQEAVTLRTFAEANPGPVARRDYEAAGREVDAYVAELRRLLGVTVERPFFIEVEEC